MLTQVRAKGASEERSRLEAQAKNLMELELETDSEAETDRGDSPEDDDSTSSADGAGVKDWPVDLRRVPASWKDRCMPHFSDAIWKDYPGNCGCPKCQDRVRQMAD